MNVIKAKNAHTALPEMMYQMRNQGIRQKSRNGDVLRLPGPTTIQYLNPLERVVFWPQRDANPFFHLLESLWMLAGRRDVAFPASLVARMADYSDDGETYNGAYGYRWRQSFFPDNNERTAGQDQLQIIAQALLDNPSCRRQVLSIWDPNHDLGLDSKDLPCNTHAYFSRNEDRCLDMMVCNRSNDAVWGALGSNCVHFSFLQEYLAAMIGCEVGTYWQMSNNMHLYVDTHGDLMNELAQLEAFPQAGGMYDPYRLDHGACYHYSLIRGDESIDMLDQDIVHPLDRVTFKPRTKFIQNIAQPMLNAIDCFKLQHQLTRIQNALEYIALMPQGCDWRLACEDWLTRRL